MAIQVDFRKVAATGLAAVRVQGIPFNTTVSDRDILALAIAALQRTNASLQLKPADLTAMVAAKQAEADAIVAAAPTIVVV